MRAHTHAINLTSLAAIGLMVAGCGGANTPGQVPLSEAQSASTQRATIRSGGPLRMPMPGRARGHAAVIGHRTSVRAAAGPFLYACAIDGNYCNVYNQKTATLLGQVTASDGLLGPGGTIVGPLGHWYIANFNAENILVFSSGGGSIISTLDDPGYFPIDVALTKKLSIVSNYFSDNSVVGNVVVYKKGATHPSYSLGDPNAYVGIGVATDPIGNCYWSFDPLSGPAQIDEFPGCAEGSSPINLGLSIASAGGMAFDAAGNLWYVDQTAGLYKCAGTASCTLVADSFGDPWFINFNSTDKKLFIVDADAGVDLLTNKGHRLLRPNYIVTPFVAIPPSDFPIGTAAAPPPQIPPF